MRKRLLALAAATVTTVGLAALPATAAPTPVGDPHADMADSYTSLTSAMVNLYATKSGENLSTYLSNRDVILLPSTLDGSSTTGPGNSTGGTDVTDPDTGPGTGTSELPGDPTASTPGGEIDEDAIRRQLDFDSLDVGTLSKTGGLLFSASEAAQFAGTAPLRGATIRDLNKQLSSAGLTISTKGFDSLSSYAKEVANKAATMDGAVTLASAKWASSMATLRMPTLQSPHVNSPKNPAVPAGALPFGLVMNKALTNLVVNHPNLVAQAQKNGLGSAALEKAWNNSMLNAYTQTSQSLHKMLPSPCVGDMLSVMASGTAGTAAGVKAGTCPTACIVGGQYLHNATAGLFNKQFADLGSNIRNPIGGVLNSAALKSMAAWAQAVTISTPKVQGSSLTDQNALGTCTDAAKASKETMRTTMPGVFSSLAR